MGKKYVILRNPHDQEYKLFKYVPGKELYAPNYGGCITNGATMDDCFLSAHSMFNIRKKEVCFHG